MGLSVKTGHVNAAASPPAEELAAMAAEVSSASQNLQGIAANLETQLVRLNIDDEPGVAAP